ncbi:hypothetical protein B0T21DRAFT_442225 [Apiosordaria backusii]|uniref:Uncharacterized protein n=1 Tax=Apiosordaria backusii TaxID=314023 RepID=A0AA40BK03_9PEZI|nr:hypothetical protein B0T21DRAFT_442225 [Apiosordaria backusii]
MSLLANEMTSNREGTAREDHAAQGMQKENESPPLRSQAPSFPRYFPSPHDLGASLDDVSNLGYWYCCAVYRSSLMRNFVVAVRSLRGGDIQTSGQLLRVRFTPMPDPTYRRDSDVELSDIKSSLLAYGDNGSCYSVTAYASKGFGVTSAQIFGTLSFGCPRIVGSQVGGNRQCCGTVRDCQWVRFACVFDLVVTAISAVDNGHIRKSGAKDVAIWASPTPAADGSRRLPKLPPNNITRLKAQLWRYPCEAPAISGRNVSPVWLHQLICCKNEVRYWMRAPVKGVLCMRLEAFFVSSGTRARSGIPVHTYMSASHHTSGGADCSSDTHSSGPATYYLIPDASRDDTVSRRVRVVLGALCSKNRQQAPGP